MGLEDREMEIGSSVATGGEVLRESDPDKEVAMVLLSLSILES